MLNNCARKLIFLSFVALDKLQKMKVLLLTWKSGDFVADVANYLPPFLLVVSIPRVYLGHNIYLGYYSLGLWKFLDFENFWTLKMFQFWKFSTLKFISTLKFFDFENFSKSNLRLKFFWLLNFFLLLKFWLLNYLSNMIKNYLYFLYFCIYKWNKVNI